MRWSKTREKKYIKQANKQIREKHDLLLGVAYRYTFYDDNTFATFEVDGVTEQVAKEALYKASAKLPIKTKTCLLYTSDAADE